MLVERYMHGTVVQLQDGEDHFQKRHFIDINSFGCMHLLVLIEGAGHLGFLKILPQQLYKLSIFHLGQAHICKQKMNPSKTS